MRSVVTEPKKKAVCCFETLYSVFFLFPFPFCDERVCSEGYIGAND